MDEKMKKSLDDSLVFIEMNINLLRTALSKTPVSSEQVLSNEKANLVILESLDLLKSIVLAFEDIGQPTEEELEKIAKGLYVSLKNSLDVSASVLDASTKEQAQKNKEKLKKIEEEHRERRHLIEPAKCAVPAFCRGS